MFDDIGFYGSVVNQTISRISPACLQRKQLATRWHRRQDALLAKDAQTASAVGGRASCSATAEWVHLSCILGTPLLSSASPSKDQGFASPRLPYELLALRTTVRLSSISAREGGLLRRDHR